MLQEVFRLCGFSAPFLQGIEQGLKKCEQLNYSGIGSDFLSVSRQQRWMGSVFSVRPTWMQGFFLVLEVPLMSTHCMEPCAVPGLP